MATTRLTTGAIVSSESSIGDLAYFSTVSASILNVATPSSNRLVFQYNTGNNKGELTAISVGLSTIVNYSIYGAGGQYFTESVGFNGTHTIDRAVGFNITEFQITINSRINYALMDGDINTSVNKIFVVKEHPGSTILFVTTPNTHLRMPNCLDNSTKGQLFIIKNNSGTMLTIGSSPYEEFCKIEYLDGVFTNYTVAGTSVIKLHDNFGPNEDKIYGQCVGLMNDGIRWHVVMFYNGKGTNGQGRDGGEIREITPAKAVVYGLLHESHMRVNLPAPSALQYLMIFGERTTSGGGSQIQLNAPSGGSIDGRWSEVNINITNNRHGNAAAFLISNGSAWYIAALCNMESMDSFADGLITSAGTVSATTTLGVLTNSRVSSSVWSGRSYNVFSVAPATLTSDTAIFRIFKQFNSTGVGLGLQTSAGQELFPKSYDGGGPQSRTRMFKYDAAGLLALFCVQIKVGSEDKLLFLNQYPTNF